MKAKNFFQSIQLPSAPPSTYLNFVRRDDGTVSLCELNPKAKNGHGFPPPMKAKNFVPSVQLSSAPPSNLSSTVKCLIRRTRPETYLNYGRRDDGTVSLCELNPKAKIGKGFPPDEGNESFPSRSHQIVHPSSSPHLHRGRSHQARPETYLNYG